MQLSVHWVQRLGIALLTLLIATACGKSDELDRTSAKALLDAMYVDTPKMYAAPFGIEGELSWQGEQREWGKRTLRDWFQQFEEKGLAERLVLEDTVSSWGTGAFKWEIILSEDGKKLQTDSVDAPKLLVVWTAEAGDVTGISFVDQSKTMATVTYTEVFSMSPVADISQYFNFPDMFPTEPLPPVQKSVQVQLFDDGWRVVQGAPNKFSM